MSDELTPFTTDELDEREIAEFSIDDQIRYAIYNGNYRLPDIVEISAFDDEWTADIIDEMVEEGALEKKTDMHGPFYELSTEQMDTGLDDDERSEIHAEARRKYESRSAIGDADDIDAIRTDPSIETIDGYADATETMSDATDDTITEPEKVPSEAEIGEALDDHGGMLPVDRDFDWDKHRLHNDDVPDFISANGEYDDIKLEIETRKETGKLPHFCIAGPTGCGKTTLAERIALDMGPGDESAIVIEIHCHEGLRPSNLLGMPTYVGDETWWVDGPVPKALLASQDQPVVVILDEVNRTNSRTLGVLMSMLDHQCRVTLDARGGEVITGNPMNLIVFSTMNEGEGYVVNPIDVAQKRRLGNKFYTDYIGMSDFDAEVDLITERTPIGEYAATELVECANAIRSKANSDSAISMGVPTDAMLDWASTAWAYRDQDIDKGELVKAGERAILNKFYRGDQTEENTVRETIHSFLEGMSVDAEWGDDEMASVAEAVEDEEDVISVSEETYLMCEDCGWYELTDDADDEVARTMTCPECTGPVIPKETT